MLTTEGAPVTGLTISNLDLFSRRNAVALTDAFTVIEMGSGRYCLKYTPSAAGHDFVDVSYQGQLVATFSEDIVDSQTLLGGISVSSITQNTPTPDALKISLPNPTLYTLYVYNSSDWESGNTETYQAQASTQIDSDGNWVTPSLSAVPGTYHIVIRDNSGFVQVLQPYLKV